MALLSDDLAEDSLIGVAHVVRALTWGLYAPRLPRRVRAVLMAADVDPRALPAMSDADLLAVRGIGPARLAAVRRALAERVFPG